MKMQAAADFWAENGERIMKEGTQQMVVLCHSEEVSKQIRLLTLQNRTIFKVSEYYHICHEFPLLPSLALPPESYSL